MKKLRHRKHLNPSGWAPGSMFLTVLFYCLFCKRNRKLVGTPRKSLPNSRQMCNFFSLSWDPQIHGLYCLKAYQAKLHMREKILFILPPKSWFSATCFLVWNLRLYRQTNHNSAKVRLNTSHINNTLTINTKLIYGSQFIIYLLWYGITWITEKAKSQGATWLQK